MCRPLLYCVCLLIACMLINSMETWNIIYSGDGRVATAAAAAGNKIKQGFQQTSASSVQGIPLEGMTEYKFYWVGNSTIPGAGLGVYAKTHIPADTVWNFEDTEPASTIAITLPLWESLQGLLQRIKEAGNDKNDHPLASLKMLFDVYSYMCGDLAIISLTGSTFVNHAPQEQAPPSSRLAASWLNRKTHAGGLQGQATTKLRYANSDETKPNQRKGMSPWQICTSSVALRDIQAGEEILEDYFGYTPACKGRNDCPEFMAQQQSPLSKHVPKLDSDKNWNRAVLVPSADVYVANSRSPGGGLGVFAAKDLPAGTVWNKNDASHTLAVTREQWARLLQLETALTASGVSKPLFTQLVGLLQSHGVCCQHDNRMYIPFTTSLLAKHGLAPGSGSKQQQNKHSTVNGSTSKQHRHVTQPVANAMHVGELGSTPADGRASHCALLQTVADMRHGEEIFVGFSQQSRCDWPGMQQ